MGLDCKAKALPDWFIGYEEAMEGPENFVLEKAIEDEKRTLLENETLEVAKLP